LGTHVLALFHLNGPAEAGTSRMLIGTGVVVEEVGTQMITIMFGILYKLRYDVIGLLGDDCVIRTHLMAKTVVVHAHGGRGVFDLCNGS